MSSTVLVWSNAHAFGWRTLSCRMCWWWRLPRFPVLWRWLCMGIWMYRWSMSYLRDVNRYKRFIAMIIKRRNCMSSFGKRYKRGVRFMWYIRWLKEMRNWIIKTWRPVLRRSRRFSLNIRYVWYMAVWKRRIRIPRCRSLSPARRKSWWLLRL